MLARVPVAAALLLATAASPEKPLTPQSAVTFFIEAQDVPPFTSEEMAERGRMLGNEPEAAAADAALNQWKLCVGEALTRWAPLNQGPGTLIDGAFGRCADIQRDYRLNLTRMTPGGRQVIDINLSRTMTRSLEEAWRPRLVAATLEQALARLPATPVPSPKPPTPPPSIKERATSRPAGTPLAGRGGMR